MEVVSVKKMTIYVPREEAQEEGEGGQGGCKRGQRDCGESHPPPLMQTPWPHTGRSHRSFPVPKLRVALVNTPKQMWKGVLGQDCIIRTCQHTWIHLWHIMDTNRGYTELDITIFNLTTWIKTIISSSCRTKTSVSLGNIFYYIKYLDICMFNNLKVCE